MKEDLSNLIFCVYGRSVNILRFLIFLKVDKICGIFFFLEHYKRTCLLTSK